MGNSPKLSKRLFSQRFYQEPVLACEEIKEEELKKKQKRIQKRMRA